MTSLEHIEGSKKKFMQKTLLSLNNSGCEVKNTDVFQGYSVKTLNTDIIMLFWNIEPTYREKIKNWFRILRSHMFVFDFEMIIFLFIPYKKNMDFSSFSNKQLLCCYRHMPSYASILHKFDVLSLNKPLFKFHVKLKDQINFSTFVGFSNPSSETVALELATENLFLTEPFESNEISIFYTQGGISCYFENPVQMFTNSISSDKKRLSVISRNKKTVSFLLERDKNDNNKWVIENIEFYLFFY